MLSAVAGVTGMAGIAVVAWPMMHGLPLYDSNECVFVAWIPFVRVVGPMTVVLVVLTPIAIGTALKRNAGANQASDATSEAAPGAESSTREG